MSAGPIHLRRHLDTDGEVQPYIGGTRADIAEPMSSGFVPAIFDRLSREYPKVIFHVTQADPATLQMQLQSRDIELAVGRLPARLPKDGYNAEILFQEPVFIAAAQSAFDELEIEIRDALDPGNHTRPCQAAT